MFMQRARFRRRFGNTTVLYVFLLYLSLITIVVKQYGVPNIIPVENHIVYNTQTNILCDEECQTHIERKSYHNRRALAFSQSDRPNCSSLSDVTERLNISERINITETAMFNATSLLEKIQVGGHSQPGHCQAHQRLAVIVPFRNRSKHLRALLPHIHAVLQKQEVDYTVYVVEQFGTGKWNKGILYNAGFLESRNIYNHNCFIFHDVDLLPEHDLVPYRCNPDNPVHISVAIDKFSYKLPYAYLIGGVSAFTEKQFMGINGFSNSYWGWGGEDDDVSRRIFSSGYKIIQPAANLGRFRMIKHDHDPANPKNPQRRFLLKRKPMIFTREGLSSVQYRLLHIKRFPLFTRFMVDVGEQPVRTLPPPSRRSFFNFF